MIINNLTLHLDGPNGLLNHVKIVNKTFHNSCAHLKFRLADKWNTEAEKWNTEAEKWNTELKNGTLKSRKYRIKNFIG